MVTHHIYEVCQKIKTKTHKKGAANFLIQIELSPTERRTFHILLLDRRLDV
jgi:hypothetical protein